MRAHRPHDRRRSERSCRRAAWSGHAYSRARALGCGDAAAGDTGRDAGRNAAVGSIPAGAGDRALTAMAETIPDLRDVARARAYAELKAHSDAILDGIDDEITAMATFAS